MNSSGEFKVDLRVTISGLIIFAGATILTFALLPLFVSFLSKRVAFMFAGVATLYPPIIAGALLLAVGIVIFCFPRIKNARAKP